jgi:hypothetical protein
MPGRLARALTALLGPRQPLPGAVHVCAVCHRDCVNPVAWDVAGEERWRVVLRCGACGHEHTRELSDDDAVRLLTALDRGYFEIETAVHRLEREQMADWVETFIAALRRDLIDAGDFRAAGPANPRSSLP